MSSRGVRAARWRLTAAVVVLAGVWLVMLLYGGGPLDRALYQTLYAGPRPAEVAVARFFTALGEPTFLVAAGVACALWLWYAGKGRLALVLIAVTMLGRGLAEAQKYAFARVRPDLEPHLVVVKTSSFPSGHATSSMIFFLTVALALTAGRRWHRLAVGGAVLLSLLVGTSRVMLGVHWPSDVIGGWSFGALWVMLTLRLAERLFRTDSDRGANAL
jgi:undecaprenyl-diphosphatase